MIEIISKIKKKDADAVAYMYNNYGKKLYGYAISKWNLNEDEAWDIIYKTLYKVVEVIDNYSFENENKFIGFVFKIFINYLRNNYRDKKNKQIDTVELTEKDERRMIDKSTTEYTEVLSDQMKCLQEQLKKLEDWKRIVLLMRAQNYSYEEIAKYAHKPADQLKVYHMRLKKEVTDGTNECINKKKQ